MSPKRRLTDDRPSPGYPGDIKQQLAVIRARLERSLGERRQLESKISRKRWETEHLWRRRPLDERKQAIAASDELEVTYDGAGYGAWDAPEGGYRAKAVVMARSTRGIEVRLSEPLMVGTGMHFDKSKNPAVSPLYEAGSVLRFTTGGKHRDQPVTTIVALPCGWRPQSFPGTDSKIDH